MIAPTYHRGDTMNYTPINCHGCQSCEFRCDHVIGYTDADGKPVSIHAAMERIAELEAHTEYLTKLVEGRIDQDLICAFLHAQDDTFVAGVNVPYHVSKFFAEMFAAGLQDAPNYQTSTLRLNADKYELTIRRVGGKTPDERIGELEAKIAAMLESQSPANTGA